MALSLFLLYYEFFFFYSQKQLTTQAKLNRFIWLFSAVLKATALAPAPFKSARTGNPFAEELSFSYRVDIFFRLLLPAAMFTTVSKNYQSTLLNQFTYMIISPAFLDIFTLLLFSNPLFLNTKLFDVSAFISNAHSNTFKVLYYVYKIPSFSTWLVFFTPYESFTTNSSCRTKVISIEKLFKAAAWAEREVGELFGICFLAKITNRKLVTDYFFKVYPLLKWVPSIGFTEVYCSAEGFFANRSVKVFNSCLS